MISEKNRKFLYFLLIVLGLILGVIISEVYNTNKLDSPVYWKFQFVSENVDSLSEAIKIAPVNKKLSQADIDTLSIILENWGWEFHVSKDSNIFIRKYTNDILKEQWNLNNEYHTHLKDSGINWKYK